MPASVKKNDTHFQLKHNYALPIRRTMHEGEETLVVPVIMLVEGVHRGSGGPLLYLEEEFGKDPYVWNGVPVPVYHPTTQNGEPLSCNSPDVIEKCNVGRIYNAYSSDGKLRAEAWINIAKANKVDPCLISNLESGMPMDVSTGMFTTDEIETGTWNGEEYIGIVRNIKPDHLALLPGQEGACNWKDGCGVRANQKGGEKENMANEGQMGILEKARKAIDVILEAAKDPANSEQMKEHFETLKGLFKKAAITNSVSDDKIRMQLQQIIEKDNIPAKTLPGKYNYVVQVYSEDAKKKYFVFEVYTEGQPSKYYKQAFSVDKDVVSLQGTPKEVKEEFVAASSESNTDEPKKEVRTMAETTREQKVKDLIACSKSIFTADDEGVLMAMDDSGFEKIVAINERVVKEHGEALVAASAPASAGVPVNTEDPKINATKEKPKTLEQYLESAPPEIKTIVNRQMAADAAQKEKLVGVLTANENCPFTAEQLKAKEIPELEALCKLAGQKEDYSGAGGSLTNPAPAVNERHNDGTGVPASPGILSTLCKEKK